MAHKSSCRSGGLNPVLDRHDVDTGCFVVSSDMTQGARENVKQQSDA